MNELEVVFNVPIMDFIRTMYPVGFIVIIVGLIAVFVRIWPAILSYKSGERELKRQDIVILKLITQKYNRAKA